MYAADYSVSPEVAARRLDRIQPLHELMAAIREAEAERVAGWGIDHSPTFTGWVLLTGTEAPTAVSAATGEANADLEIRTGAAPLGTADDTFETQAAAYGAGAHFSAILEVESFLGVSVLTAGDRTVR